MEEKKFIVQPYPNEHVCRLHDPDKYDTFSRMDFEDHNGKKFYGIIGYNYENGSEVQAYRYDKDVWSAEDAEQHCKKRSGKFEPAKITNDIFTMQYQVNEYQVDTIWVDNKKFVRLPVVFLKEGILNGSQGALFHSADVFKNFADKFDKIPLTYMHPQNSDGDFISVNEDKSNIIGYLSNVEYDGEGKQLKGKIYIEQNLLQDKYSHLQKLIEQNYPIEVSIGVYSSIQIVEDKDYKGIVMDYIPDHLAVLGEVKGACSYEYGCGIRNNQHKADEIYNNKTNKKMVEMDEKKLTLNELLEKLDDKDKSMVTQALSLLENKKKELIDVIVNANPKWDKKELENECVSQLEKIAEAINNVAKKVEVEQIANVSKEKDNEQANYVANATSTTVETSILTL